MREIVLDTETTGLNFSDGDRIVEIGCVELVNHLPTGRSFHCYVNPQRTMHPDATRISGITDAQLADKPIFMDIVDSFLEFIAEDPLVIHNAPFDMGFLNGELGKLCRSVLCESRVRDTLVMARQKFPRSPVSLDALCKRFQIDLSARQVHGALLDAQLLAQVYLELVGGRQIRLDLTSQTESESGDNAMNSTPQRVWPTRRFPISEEELKAHAEFLQKDLPENALWHTLKLVP